MRSLLVALWLPVLTLYCTAIPCSRSAPSMSAPTTDICVTVERPGKVRHRRGVRWSSAVDSTIELACTGVAHKFRALPERGQPCCCSLWVSGLSPSDPVRPSVGSGMAAGAWCRIRAPSSGPTLGSVRSVCAKNVTQMYHILTTTSRRRLRSMKLGPTPMPLPSFVGIPICSVYRIPTHAVFSTGKRLDTWEEVPGPSCMRSSW